MAKSPDHIVIITDDGVGIVPVRYVRPFRQAVRVDRCWASIAGIDHACDEMGCWQKP